MADEGNWNIRFDGPPDSVGLTGALSYAALQMGDLNNDGEDDIAVSARRYDANGRNDSGSLYIIYSDLFRSLGGTGNTIDLSDPNNYNLRYDGAVAGDEGGRSIIFPDLDSDGKLDLAFVNYQSDFNGRASSGAVYVIYNTLLDDYSGTGNTIDLANAASYNLRFDGATTNENLGSVTQGDIDNDEKDDLVISGLLNYNNGGVRNGGLYVILNTLIDGYSGTGNNIDLANSANWNTRIDGSTTTTTATGAIIIGAYATWADAIILADFDNDAATDLLVGAPAASYHDQLGRGSLYLISNDILDYSGTGNIMNLNNATDWSIRYDGSAASPGGCNFFTCGGVMTYFRAMQAGDLDNDNKIDIVFSENASRNGRSFSGSTYVVYDELIDDYSGTGNIVLMENATNYNIRFDGAEANDHHTAGAWISIADLSNDGKNDLAFGAVGDPVQGTLTAGKVYVIFQELLEEYVGTGNVIDLAMGANWNFRYDGSTAGDWLSASALSLHDLNQDGGKDVIMGAWGTDFNGAGAGSLYVVYYFPHEFELDEVFHSTSGNPFLITGTVHAPDNPTHIELVQWGHDRSFGDPESEGFFDTWKDCTASDGAFDSNEERFVCSHRALNDGSGGADPHFTSPHTVFFRARDSKGIYTPVAMYPTDTYLVASPISGIGASGGKETATIAWSTSEPGSSQVEYGLTANYGSITVETDTAPRVTSHAVSLTGLSKKCTKYHYRVISRDIAGNEAASSDQTVDVSCKGGRVGTTLL